MAATGAARLVVVDDEPDIRATVADYLFQCGYAVAACGSGAELDAELGRAPADLVVLDIAMPGEDGISIARRIRSNGAPGIIMLSALGDTVDRVVGLEVGADDYVTKPFLLRELKARVSAVLRRAPRPEADRPADLRFTRFGEMRFDREARRLVDPDGCSVALTPMEYDLLAAFADHPNRVLSRDRLLDLAHHRRLEPFDRAIDIRVARIRKKVEPDPAMPRVIKTVPGAGYIYVPTPA